jgi:integrase
MAFIETREGKRETSHRVIWRYQKQRVVGAEAFRDLGKLSQDADRRRETRAYQGPKREHIPCNPSEGTRLPKLVVGDEQNKFLTEEEFNTILPHVEGRYRPYAIFLFYTGLRGSEMLALTPEDFTMVRGVADVSVNKAMKRNASGPGAHVGEPKSETSRRRIDVDSATMAHVWPLIRAAG